ncbi:redoxin domain-containing protein [Streptomyces sp. TRM49041]|uniref:redoxin domain-containing protein n=1 Tax=Streptomyces sp. TRM49041 TaxID=2603216 RepID=UPI0021CCE517|nr:redoxin domain-containing protein [Streptomyces sp. TRM49041]
MMRARRSAPRALAATVSLLAAVALTGCGGGTGDAEAPTTTPSGGAPASASAPADTASSGSPSGTPDTGAPAVPETLRFTGTTLDGKSFDGATLAGRPTVLWFWAPWCPTCKAQSAETARVAAEYAGRADVVGVAGLDKRAAMEKFAADNKVDGFPQLSDESGDIWKKFEITQQSTYVVLDKDGEAVFTGVLKGGKGLADKLGDLVGRP